METPQSYGIPILIKVYPEYLKFKLIIKLWHKIKEKIND